MKILVTGGAGYIGSHTCVELLQKNYDVIVVDNLSNSSKEALKRVELITGKKIIFYEADIRDEKTLNSIFETHEIEAVIHFEGLKAVGESVEKPIEYYDNNINSTLTLCKVMKRFGKSKLIFSSSATVYHPENSIPLTEDAVLGCTNPYGWTKYMCEQILKDAYAADKNWSVILLRYFNPIGAHESGMLGEDPSDIPNNLLPYISQTAIGKREKLSIYGNDYETPDGTGVRDYIHVVDLAKGHVMAIDYMNQYKGINIFNLGTGMGTSVLQMVHTFEEINQVKVPYQIVDRRPGDQPVCYADPSKARDILGWTAEKGLEEMCRDVWHWQKNNPNGYRD